MQKCFAMCPNWKEPKRRELMRDIYISVESLRNASDYLDQHMLPWIEASVEYCDDPFDLEEDGEPVEMDTEALWTSLGAKGAWRDLLVEVNPCFLHGRLRVAAHLQATPDGGKRKIKGCLKYLWRHSRFTESRWLQVRQTSQQQASGFTCGMSSVVDRVLDDPHAHNWHINGYGARMKLDRKQWVVKTAIGGSVGEAVQGELMKSDRVPARLREFEAIRSYLWFLPDRSLPWESGCAGRRRRLANRAVPRLRRSALQGKHVDRCSIPSMWVPTYAYFVFEFFLVLKSVATSRRRDVCIRRRTRSSLTDCALGESCVIAYCLRRASGRS